MALTLALPALLDLLLENQRTLAKDWGDAASLTVFVRPGTALDAARTTAERLATDRDVGEVKVIEAKAAFAEFRAASGMDGGLDIDSLLPHVLIVTPTAAARSQVSVGRLVERIKARPEIDEVAVDFAWVDRLAALGELARRSLLVLAAFLAGATMLIVGNTVRAMVEEHQMTINVLKLVGATDAYVRRPFLYSGALHGLLAGLVALGLVALVVAALSQPVERLAQAYASSFKLAGLPATHAAILVAGATLLGWLGALIGLGFKLRQMQPRA